MIAPGSVVPEVDVYDGKGAAPLPVFFDGPALLLFFGAGCRRCEGMLGLAAGIGRISKGLSVIGISQETIEDTAQLLKQLGVRLPVVIDDRPYPAAIAFQIETLPALALLEDDRIVFTSDGCNSQDLDEFASRVARWTRDVPIGLVPEYLDAAGIRSNHL